MAHEAASAVVIESVQGLVVENIICFLPVVHPVSNSRVPVQRLSIEDVVFWRTVREVKRVLQ